VSSVQSNGFELAVELEVASGDEARGVEDRVKTVGWLGVAAAAVPVGCIPVIDEIRSKVVIRIEETEVNLLSFELILRGAKASVFYI
jgi:hypothetical protein